MPVWMYKLEDKEVVSHLFNDGDEIGKEWKDSPACFDVSEEGELDIDALKAEAEELGIKVHHKAKAETIAKQIAEAKGE